MRPAQEGRARSRSVSPATNTERILEHVVANPGAYLMAVSRAVGVTHSAVRDQLAWLESEGHLLTEERGRERHYYAAYSPMERRMVPVLLASEAWRLLEHVARRPGVENQGELTVRLGLSKDGMQAAVRGLLDVDFVETVAVASARRPGIGYVVPWKRVVPLLRLLAIKLPPGSPVGERTLGLLELQPLTA